MKLYVAGPMRGKSLYNFPAFHEAAAALRLKGHTVINPAEMDVEAGQDPNVVGMLPMPVYLKRDLLALLDCDGIVLLPGWSYSAGASLELRVAGVAGLKVFFYETSLIPWA